MNSCLSYFWNRAASHVWLVSVVLSGAVTIFYDQASSPDYWMLLGVAGTCLSVHVMLAIPYVIRIRSWSRWVAMVSFVLASGSYVEMAVRVWLR